jgi:hypothetical protein
MKKEGTYYIAGPEGKAKEPAQGFVEFFQHFEAKKGRFIG